MIASFPKGAKHGLSSVSAEYAFRWVSVHFHAPFGVITIQVSQTQNPETLLLLSLVSVDFMAASRVCYSRQELLLIRDVELRNANGKRFMGRKDDDATHAGGGGAPGGRGGTGRFDRPPGGYRSGGPRDRDAETFEEGCRYESEVQASRKPIAQAPSTASVPSSAAAPPPPRAAPVVAASVAVKAPLPALNEIDAAFQDVDLPDPGQFFVVGGKPPVVPPPLADGPAAAGPPSSGASHSRFHFVTSPQKPPSADVGTAAAPTAPSFGSVAPHDPRRLDYDDARKMNVTSGAVHLPPGVTASSLQGQASTAPTVTVAVKPVTVSQAHPSEPHPRDRHGARGGMPNAPRGGTATVQPPPSRSQAPATASAPFVDPAIVHAVVVSATSSAAAVSRPLLALAGEAQPLRGQPAATSSHGSAARGHQTATTALGPSMHCAASVVSTSVATSSQPPALAALFASRPAAGSANRPAPSVVTGSVDAATLEASLMRARPTAPPPARPQHVRQAAPQVEQHQDPGAFEVTSEPPSHATDRGGEYRGVGGYRGEGGHRGGGGAPRGYERR